MTSGHIGIIQLPLDHSDIDPNFVAIDGRTALIQAIDPDVAKRLLDQEDFDVNHQDHSGLTALCKAARYSNLEVARVLEREDVDINVCIISSKGDHVLGCSAYEGDITAVKLLLGHPDTAQTSISRRKVAVQH